MRLLLSRRVGYPFRRYLKICATLLSLVNQDKMHEITKKYLRKTPDQGAILYKRGSAARGEFTCFEGTVVV